MVDEPFTEPVLVPCLFCSGTACEFLPGFTRLVCWVSLPALPAEPHERRIIARLVLPDTVAMMLLRQLQQGLKNKVI